MHNRFSVIRGKLTKDNKFECQTCAKQQAEDCTSMERNDQSPMIFPDMKVSFKTATCLSISIYFYLYFCKNF